MKPSVTVLLPSLLEPVTGGVRELTVWGGSLREVFDDLIEREPRLRRHLFNEAGEFRRHVLCFHNGTNTRWLGGRSAETADSPGGRRDGWDTQVQEGDTVLFMQAVSGG
ncbi:MAG: MoaD/ThiS family protein [Gemmatimonadetes bacterium]|nr:MoaD/ThiS family protein [Gemmatimonadota bacterium]